MSGRARSCRSMPTTPTGHRMHAEHAVLSRRDRGGAQCGACQGRADRGGRLDGAAHARKRRGRRRHDQAVFGRHRAVHHAGLPLQGGGRDDDQLPPAALDAVHAGVGVLRPRHDAARLRACDRGGLSVLFLWRCVPAIPGAHERRPFLLPPDRNRRRRAPRRDSRRRTARCRRRRSCRSARRRP